MLVVRTRQLTTEDFHLIRRAALSAAPTAGLVTTCQTISLATSCRSYKLSGGYYMAHSEPSAAHEFAVHVATQSGCVKRLHHRHPPRAQPVAPLRERHCRRPRLPPRCGTAQAPHRKQGHPGGRTREEQRPHRCTCLVMRGPPASPLFASWPWPRHHCMLVGSS